MKTFFLKLNFLARPTTIFLPCYNCCNTTKVLQIISKKVMKKILRPEKSENISVFYVGQRLNLQVRLVIGLVTGLDSIYHIWKHLVPFSHYINPLPVK